MLTPKEMQILYLLREGYGTKAMCAKQHRAVGTIKNHVRHILKKLKAKNRWHAVAIAFDTGLLVVNGPNYPTIIGTDNGHLEK